MNDYFDQVEQGMREAVRRRRHIPWYIRLASIGRPRALVLVLAALVVATPAVGAATGWFGIGAPDRFPPQSPTQFAGRALPGTSQLLALRVPDPQGGPPWGLRVVHTTRGDTCIQVGRVEDGRLGSLGIDDAWNNDHLFHPFPNTSIDTCGTTDAAGNGFVNVARTGVVASANPTAGAAGAQAKSCRPLLTPVSGRPDRRPGVTGGRPGVRATGAPQCAPGTVRMVFTGLLGPDATSVTYQAPDGSLKSEKTSGSDGAYLLVFTFNQAACNLYTHGPFGSYGPCGAAEAFMGPSPGSIGAVKAVSYRDGHVCRLAPDPRFLAAFNKLRKRLSSPNVQGRPFLAQRAFQRFLTAEHLTRTRLQALLRPTCPPIGYVSTQQKPVTTADVATPITVRMLAPKYKEFRVDIVFTARQPVTSSSSWYEDYMTNPRTCSSSGQGGEIGFGNIRAGQLIHDTRLIGGCKGTYRGLIGYMPNSGPINQEASGGGIPGHDGSIVVGRFSFTIR